MNEIDERLFYKSSPSLSTVSTISSSDSESAKNNTKKSENKQKSLYKTELCRNWEETNHCRYGAKCQYAHGAADLREIERHPKYKTQKCRTFHQTGACPYGSRCTFRHFNLPGEEVEEPVKKNEIKSLFDNNDDFMLPNAESLLPHQLLFDLESPDQTPPPPSRRCPLRNYVNLPPSFSYQQPSHHFPQEKSFFHPWLF